jgi:hypothetical protein
MRDAPFSLLDTVDFVHTDPYREGAQEHSYAGRPAVSAFHDSIGYYPGAEYVHRGPAYPAGQFRWVTKQWDASVVVPSRTFYGIKAPGYTANEQFRFNCIPYLSGPYTGYLGCYWLGPTTGLGYDGGTGNPGDYDGQYGWHAQVLEQAADGSRARVRIWNSLYEVRTAIDMGAETLPYGQIAQATYQITENIGGRVSNLLAIVEVPGNTTYVPDSEFGGLVPIPGSVASSAAEAAAYASSLGHEKVATEAKLNAAQAGDVRYLVWFASELGTQMGSPEFGFSYQAIAAGTAQSQVAFFRDGFVPFQTVDAPAVTITPVEVTVDVPVMADAHLSANEPATNFGGWSKLYVGHNDTLRPVLAADLSGIPTTAEVTQATLYLWVDSFAGGGSPHTLSVHQVLTPWDEATATWRTPWSTAGGDFDPTAAGSATISSASAGQWVTIDLTSLVQGGVTYPSANMGALLQATGESVSRFLLASSEYWDSTKRPYLRITYRSPSG